MSERLLTFEIEDEELSLHMNDEGAEFLMKKLQDMLGKENDHEHLLTAEWGGDELSSEKQSDKAGLLNKVTLHIWNK